MVAIEGLTSGSAHSYAEEEVDAFINFINSTLGGDKDLQKYKKVPLAEGGALERDGFFSACNDGLLIAKLINAMVEDTIDERALAMGGKLNNFSVLENNTICLESAKAIGCSVVNVRPKDLVSGNKVLILGLVWQIIRIGLFSQITLANHPELYRLLEDDETIEDLLALPIDQLLLRWMNYHLKNAGSEKRVKNFGGDIKDSEAYTVVLNQVGAGLCDTKALGMKDPLARAEHTLDQADNLDCRKFLAPRDIVNGVKKLNLAFVANLFNMHPGLEPVEDVDMSDIVEETREVKTFRNWMNSLGVEPFVGSLFEDLRDGLILLQLFEKIQPGILNERRVNRKPRMIIHMVQNCNYAVELGKQLGFSLVGIGGKDITDANQTLTLALVWQMMRFHSLALLNSLGENVTDSKILQWANAKVKESGLRIRSFGDKKLRDSKYLGQLLETVRPGCLDLALLDNPRGAKGLFANAKYVITIARKIGATVFALPDDIVECSPKMIMLVIAGIMSVDGAKVAPGSDKKRSAKAGSKAASPRRQRKPKSHVSGIQDDKPRHRRSSGVRMLLRVVDSAANPPVQSGKNFKRPSKE